MKGWWLSIQAWNWETINWELRRKEWLWPVMRHHRSTYIERLKKATSFQWEQPVIVPRFEASNPSMFDPAVLMLTVYFSVMYRLLADLLRIVYRSYASDSTCCMNPHEDNKRWPRRMFPPILQCQGICVRRSVRGPGVRLDGMIRRESASGFRFLIFMKSRTLRHCFWDYSSLAHSREVASLSLLRG